MKNILIIEPGFKFYKELPIKEIKKQKVSITFAIGLSNIIDYSWLQNYSDEIIMFSYAHKDLEKKIDEFIIKKNIHFHGALTLVDTSVPYLIEIQKHLNLPLVSTLNKNIKNKFFVRDIIQEKEHFYNPSFFMLCDSKKKYKINNKLFPLIVKPTEMMASLGVEKVNNNKELNTSIKRNALIDFQGENLRTHYKYLDDKILIEKYIEGQEYSVECAVSKGITTILGISLKNVQDTNEIGDLFPYNKLAPNINKNIKTFAEKIHHALKIQNSITHIEFKLKDENPILIEINCRLAGDYMPALLLRSGINLGDLLVKNCTGETFNTSNLCISSAFYQLEKKEGRVINIQKTKYISSSNYRSLIRKGDLLIKHEGKDLIRVCEIYNQKKHKIALNIQIQEPIFKKSLTLNNNYLYGFTCLPEDFNTICEIEKKSWSAYLGASKDILKKRFFQAPDNFIIAYSSNENKPVGFIYWIPLKESSLNNIKRWEDVLKKSDESGSNCRYIVSLSILPYAPRGTGTQFMLGLTDYLRTINVKKIQYGIRLPNYYHYAENNMDIHEYFNKIKKSEIVEPSYKMAIKSGGKVLKILNDYYDDPESKNYALSILHQDNSI